MADLKSKIESFMVTWGAKLGDSALKAANDAVNYGASQEVSLQVGGSLKFDSNGFVYNLTLTDYWEYIERGVDGWDKSHGSPYKYKKDGKMIPKKSLMHFFEMRGLQPTQSIAAHQKALKVKGKGKLSKKIKKSIIENDKDKSLNNMLFAMSHVIKRDGIEPRPFVKNIMTPELKKELYAGLRDIMKEELIINFKTA